MEEFKRKMLSSLFQRRKRRERLWEGENHCLSLFKDREIGSEIDYQYFCGKIETGLSLIQIKEVCQCFKIHNNEFIYFYLFFRQREKRKMLVLSVSKNEGWEVGRIGGDGEDLNF